MLTVSIITARPSIIPKIPIFTMGLEIDAASFLLLVILSAMNFSAFNRLKVLWWRKNKKLIALTLTYFFVLGSPAQSLCIKEYSTVVTGAQRFNEYLPQLKNKRVAVITNPTGLVGKRSIVDTLISLKVRVVKIFGPEHGFRGDTEAGVKVNSNKDSKTGLPVISLYGNNKKPSKEQLQGVDIVIYDIQDVGVRFYTYISTMCYAMEACAENNKEMIVLDRPNPNGFYIDGPVMENTLRSFLGLHKVPVVYGMTCGEYAKMANEEGWLANGIKCKLSVIPCLGYDRNCSYKLQEKPSPNLPDITSVLLYPSLGLFEGVNMSVGRGTPMPFKVIGHPQYPDTLFSFVPKANAYTKNPLFFNQTCYGMDLSSSGYLKNHPKKIAIHPLMEAYAKLKSEVFFNKGFNVHAGNSLLKEQIIQGVSEEEIRKSWEPDLKQFKAIRSKYLIYPDHL